MGIGRAGDGKEAEANLDGDVGDENIEGRGACASGREGSVVCGANPQDEGGAVILIGLSGEQGPVCSGRVVLFMMQTFL